MIVRMGVLGGTFDPLHNAHLAMAEGAMDLLRLESVHFMVSACPPHKVGGSTTSAAHRLAMVALATSGREGLVPSAVELEDCHGAPSYTVDALDAFCRRHGADPGEIVFLAGGDSLRDLPLWRASDELLARYRFFFCARAGWDASECRLVHQGRVRDLRGADREAVREALQDGCSVLVDLGLPDVASSKIRLMLQSGLDCSGLLPASVSDYIRKTNLYGVQ